MMAGRGLLVAALAVLTASCDTGTFDPFDNGERYFTVFGFLDERSATHSVRVIPITRFAADIPTPHSPQASIDAVVTSTDLRTGTVTRWDHSLEQLEDGSYGHIFRARFQAIAGRTYRLEITRNDGTVTSAETTIPRLPITIPNPDTLFFPFEVSPDSALSQEVFLPDIPSPWEINVVYDLEGRQYRLPYGRVGRRTEDGGWRFTIDLAADAPRLRQVVGLGESGTLPLLHALTLQVRLLALDWDPPAGVFDPEVLAQPGVMTNVDQGYGIWAGMGLYQYTWIQPAGKTVEGAASYLVLRSNPDVDTRDWASGLRPYLRMGVDSLSLVPADEFDALMFVRRVRPPNYEIPNR